ncbi:unnamed protein product, partial [Scytosiphon promiscuus]
SWCAEQVFGGGDGNMRRTSRSHWDADGSLDHRENLSPRSQQLDGEHLLPLAGSGGDDMFGDHAGSGGAGGGSVGAGGGSGGGGGGGGGGSLLPSVLEAGISALSPRAGGIGCGGGGGTSPRDRAGSGGGGGG